MIGGDPGIGKSTIVMQALARIAKNNQSVMYVSGEESASQIKLRADRMGISNDGISVLTENCVELILDHIRKSKPAVVAIDSIQTMYTNDLTSAPGSIGQVRESSAKILCGRKASGNSIVLRRSRDEGWRNRRAKGSRAYGRHGALLRR